MSTQRLKRAPGSSLSLRSQSRSKRIVAAEALVLVAMVTATVGGLPGSSSATSTPSLRGAGQECRSGPGPDTPFVPVPFGNASGDGAPAVQFSAPVVSMVADPVQPGYWLVAIDGGIFSCTSPFYGSMGGRPLDAPVVGMAPTPTGGGYWEVASDGGIFAFGAAQFHGSMGGRPLDAPVVGMAGDVATGGYWLASADGGVFSFTAPFYGSLGASAIANPIEAIASDAAGTGYWLLPVQADPLDGAAPYLASRVGTALAAVYDLTTGQLWSTGAGGPQTEASIVKVDILETLLNQSGGQGLTPSDQSLAQSMIEHSTNTAATTLWYRAGGVAAISAYNSAAGLDQTTPPTCITCVGFPWPGWGLTTTTPTDQIELLLKLVRGNSLLTGGERGYELTLMEHVTPSQAWGVSGGVTPQATVALKNGWLPLGATGGDWQINSIGWVSGAGRNYLIAVMTTGDPTEQYGIDTVDQVSSTVWAALG